MTTLPLSHIRIDGGTQSRVEIDLSTVRRYAEDMRGGATFPPIVVFHDGAENWMGDGFHRYHAMREAGIEETTVELRPGTRRDAILYSVGANAKHGLPRSNDDKRLSVRLLLEDETWGEWSNREIARQCAVSEYMVRQLRDAICDKNADRRKAQRNGKTYTINTANIGKGQASPAPAPPPSVPPSAAQVAETTEDEYPPGVWVCPHCQHANTTDPDVYACSGCYRSLHEDEDEDDAEESPDHEEPPAAPPADSPDPPTLGRYSPPKEEGNNHPDPTVWTEEELALLERIQAGETIVLNMSTHRELLVWAEQQRLFVRIDRRSDWGNPFILGKDGDREAVCRNYEDHYLPYKPSLLSQLSDLAGKALGCWCAPERCHGHVLVEWSKG